MILNMLCLKTCSMGRKFSMSASQTDLDSKLGHIFVKCVGS